MNKLSLGAVLPVLLIIACIGGGYFFSYDQWAKYSDAKEALSTAQTNLDAVKKAQSDVNGFLDEYRRSLDSQPKVDRALPPGTPNIPVVLAQIEKLALDSGMSVGSINAKENSSLKVTEPNAVSYINFDLQVKGTYAAFKNLLLLLEQNLRITDVQSMTFEKEEANNMKFTIMVRMYYQK
jgi:Tfp pilus assembly protein PilO